MSRLGTEPFIRIGSLEELFAVAAAMEREAIEGYSELAGRMHREDRPALAEVFERLVAEETMHLGNVEHWSHRMTGKGPDLSPLRGAPDATFDDEGAGTVAPELMSAYRAFSMAVRNEERAFAFWTYVAAQSTSKELQKAAEQMAREELDHVARLRRERRLAFHQARAAATDGEGWTLPALENRVAALLGETARDEAGSGRARDMEALAAAARARAGTLTHAPLGETRLLKSVKPEVSARLRPAVELLLDCYLDLGERLPSQAGRDQAQAFAAELLDCLSVVREPARP
ncbi:MAG: ferritin family protein [Aquamicrobium sp.]|uniref:ferritin-like domain-containing protein n=1 Tax=Aquamicrobium sp. TaxID=1872579 RepID=UPI00349E7DC5|nr:ferritin family protein [Aquamicrobium sp.]